MLSWFKRKLGKGTTPPPEPEAVVAGQKPDEPIVAELPEVVNTHIPSSEPEAADSTQKPDVPVPEEVLDDAVDHPSLKPDAAPSAISQSESKGRSLAQRLKERLAKTRESLVNRMDDLFRGKKEIDPELLDELEEILFTADMGVSITQNLLDNARRMVSRKELVDPQALKTVLKDSIRGYLLGSEKTADLVMPESGPFVIMVVGVNGVGKTTTIGKMAHKFVNSGQSVLLVAGDTFRAAAIDQLQIWGERIGVDVIAGESGADPSSVVYDALDQQKKKAYDVIIMDTAGRLHTKVNLMEELKKINRVIGNQLPGAPHEVMLVLDATTGQNAISQVRLFNQAVPVTGLALTKLDGTAKGGIVVNICHEYNIPIRFIGIGEQMTDLRDFDSQEFVEALFAEDN